jgi:glycosyltransferase involved in cell wall biosynthesis
VATVEQLFFRIIDRGGESMAANLQRSLAARGHDVATTGFFRDRADGAPVTADWTVLVPDTNSARSTPRAVLALFRHLRRRRPDVVMAHTQVASLIGLPLALLLGVRRRVAIHHQPHGRDLGWPFWVADAIAGSVGLYTDVVLVSHVNLDAVERFPRRYLRRVTLIPNEVPPVSVPERGEARHRLGLGPDERVFCFLGAVTRRKGAHRAARAVAAAAGGVLVMAGRDGDAAVEVAELAADADGRIRLLGHLTRAEVDEVLGAADVLLMPTEAENRSLTLLEALSAGLAVVASDIPGNRHVLARTPGLLVDVDDQGAWDRAVVELLDDDRLAELRPEGGGAAAYAGMLDAYENVIEGSSVASGAGRGRAPGLRPPT